MHLVRQAPCKGEGVERQLQVFSLVSAVAGGFFGVEDLGVGAVNCRVHVVHGAVANFHVVPVEDLAHMV